MPDKPIAPRADADRSGEGPQAIWQPLESAPKGYDGKRFHYVLFRGTSRGRSFMGYAYVSGYMDHNRKPVHSYAYKLDITEWMPLPDGVAPPSAPAGSGTRVEVSREWCESMAKAEPDCDITAGANPTAQDVEQNVYYAYEAARRLRVDKVILDGLHAARRFIFDSYQTPTVLGSAPSGKCTFAEAPPSPNTVCPACVLEDPRIRLCVKHKICATEQDFLAQAPKAGGETPRAETSKALEGMLRYRVNMVDEMLENVPAGQESDSDLVGVREVKAALATEAAAQQDLLTDWREQDRILQAIAAIVGDENVTDAAGVLKATEACMREHAEELRSQRAKLEQAEASLQQRTEALTAILDVCLLASIRTSAMNRIQAIADAAVLAPAPAVPGTKRKKDQTLRASEQSSGSDGQDLRVSSTEGSER